MVGYGGGIEWLILKYIYKLNLINDEYLQNSIL